LNQWEGIILKLTVFNGSTRDGVAIEDAPNEPKSPPRRARFPAAGLAGFARLVDVDLDHPIDDEFRRENAMEPITAAIVIVAIWTPIHVGITKWVAEL
jgi:hypothetical protein